MPGMFEDAESLKKEGFVRKALLEARENDVKRIRAEIIKAREEKKKRNKNPNY